MDGSDTNRKITRRRFVRGMTGAGLAALGRFRGGVAASQSAGWVLHVHGAVDRALALSPDDLRWLGSETTAAFLECAGTGAIRTAVWTGVPLQTVLGLTGVGAGAIAAIARGEDGHQRVMALRDIASVGPLLAFAMDGEPLPAKRGGPVRLIVPGWTAEASVKRLAAVELVDRMPAGPVAANRSDRRLRPLREMPPRAIILAPAANGIVRAGRQVIRGRAWSGYAPVESVAVTLDGGDTWREAEIVERAGPRGWVAFRAEWDARPGPATLAARATDAFGLTQPLDVPERARGFVHNAVTTLPVMVAR